MSTGTGESTPNMFEFTPPPQSGEQGPTEQRPEKGPDRQETYKQPPQAQPQTDQQQPATPQPVASASAPVADNSTTAQASQSPTQNLMAEEADLIEKEWVDRAKRIVASTQDDPFKQKTEISKAKADYIQKRFNKTIKVEDTTV